jgi:hypothetical protein
MKEPYREGVATRSGPESCGGRREAAVEALTGVHADRALSCEIGLTGAPTLLTEAEGDTGDGANRESFRALRSRRPCVCVETPRRELGGPTDAR